MSTDKMRESVKLTPRQDSVLSELVAIGRKNAFAYKDKHPYLHAQDLNRLHLGDDACVWGLGGLSWQVGGRLGLSAQSVLSAFKSLEAKGLVIRETRNPGYKRPLYWWPVGLAADLRNELGASDSSNNS